MSELNNNSKLKDIKYSILDLAPIIVGGSATDTFQNTLDLAKHTERWGYHRYWLAEHHNMPGIASSATSILIGQVAVATSTIRVGSGGIMLPNHSPLVIAEQFGTLESLFPGRIDLGLGRAPGTDQRTMHALRRDHGGNGHDFPQQLSELRSYFSPIDSSRSNSVKAIPGEGLDIPIWLLGSSGFSAQLAAQLGLPFAFASHFSPENTLPALELYYNEFQPSEVLSEPYTMVAVNVIAADTQKEANRLATSMQQQFLNLVRNTPTKLQPPVENMDEIWNDFEKKALQQQLGSSIIGDRTKVKEKLEDFIANTKVNEVMINAQIYDQKARLRSFEIVSSLWTDL
ncbi:LLM class flavin-dependent oxidoreductase [Evansella tamaricis]|uniref:LLM class flavin-dependent oxidoreductase n=1 Tax=Evansella tamaricis TaxID=2069301 RepID=A0ABS6JFI6_9BACI|nr:LLM class flavin-dependent oxidoreductase [Evansella tamaricis]MBU9712155.1 LLM class flavin-dependent oxidoreductase [Evansella tamaricis]